MSEQAKCELCGEPMPPGEEMFKFHGYSGPCPKPPLVKQTCQCELCRQSFEVADMALFLLKEKRLLRTDDRDWEGKQGVRHLCQDCVFEIMRTSTPL